MCYLLVLLAFGGQQPSTVRRVEIEDVQVKLIRDVMVPAREAGALAGLDAQEGDLVEAGQTLGKIDEKLAKLQQQRAACDYQIAKIQSENNIDLRFAQKSLAVAESELERAKEAIRRFADSVSGSEIDRLALVVDRSTLSIEQAERDELIAQNTSQLKSHDLAIADERVVRQQIMSPIKGMIVEIYTQAGQWVKPGDPVLRVVQLDRLRAETLVDANQFDADLKGCPVQLSVKLPGNRTGKYKGKIGFVSPVVEPVTGQIRIWAEIENHDGKLRPGTHGTLTITLAKQES